MQGMTVTEVKGFGRTGGKREVYRGSAYVVDFVPKVKVEVVVPEAVVVQVIDAVREGREDGADRRRENLRLLGRGGDSYSNGRARRRRDLGESHDRDQRSEDVLEFAKSQGAVMVDLRFIDLPGIWQHTSVPIHRLEVASFEDGFGFDGSSIRGYQPINASDMLIVPDATTAKMDPFTKHPTLVLICNIVDPITKEPLRPRPALHRDEGGGVPQADRARGHQLLRPRGRVLRVRRRQVSAQGTEGYGHYAVDSVEGMLELRRRRGTEPRATSRQASRAATSPCIADRRASMDLRIGHQCEHSWSPSAIEIERQPTTRSRPAVSAEINFKYDTLTALRRQADVRSNTSCKQHRPTSTGKTATFMPKPIYGDNGSGMHCHQSLWKEGKPLFAGDGYAGMSDMALNYIGGLLQHAPSICALTNPTINSYRRLVPGYEAPVNLALQLAQSLRRGPHPDVLALAEGAAHRGALPRLVGQPVPGFLLHAPRRSRGRAEETPAGDPLDKDIYSLSPEELKDVPTVPHTLEGAVDALERDHEFLLVGDVFTKDIVTEWIGWKRENEIAPMRLRPTPLEYELYYDL